MIAWHEAKRARNIAKHGVDLARAEGFAWGTAMTAIDDRADYGEVREVALGLIGRRLYVMVFTRRGDDIHVIGLRKANKRECARYDKTET